MTKTPMLVNAAAMLTVCLVLPGCSWTGDHTPVPVPTSAPSPGVTTGPSPSPTRTETAQERQVRLDREAAFTAYQLAGAETDELAMAGGVSEPTTVLTDNTAGAYLAAQLAELQGLESAGIRASQAPDRSVTAADEKWSPTELGIIACEDASSVRLLDQTGREVRTNRPRLFVRTITAEMIDGRWKLVGIRSQSVRTFEQNSACGGP